MIGLGSFIEGYSKKMVTNTRPAPPWKPPVAVCKSPGGQMTSQQYQLRQQAMQNDQRQMSYEELMSNREYEYQMMYNDLVYKAAASNLNMMALQSQQSRWFEEYQQPMPPPARSPPPVDSYFDRMKPGDSMRIDKRLLDDNPSWKVSLLGSEFDVENHHSGDIFIRKRTMKEIQQAKEEGKKAVASEIPSEYRDLADIGSEMFDPLTCLKNGIPWQTVTRAATKPKLQLWEREPNSPKARAMKRIIDMRQKTHSTGLR